MAITIRYKTFVKSWMIEMALPKFNSNTFRAAALSGLIFVTPAFAAEQGCEACHTQTAPAYTSSVDAINAAQEFARTNNGIGVVVTFGDFEGSVSPDKVGQRFVEVLEDKGQEAAYYVYIGDTPGYSISFALGENGMGPMSAPEAMKNIDEVVASKRRMSNLLAAAPN